MPLILYYTIHRMNNFIYYLHFQFSDEVGKLEKNDEVRIMLIRLSWKDRKIISEVARLYCDMAMTGEGYEDRIRQFWRISMYVKVCYLSPEDAKTILVAMEEFHRTCRNDSSFRDPKGTFRGLDQTIASLRAIVA